MSRRISKNLNISSICLAAIIIVLGFVLRIHKIGKNELWLDEAYSAITAQKSLSQIVETQKNDTSPPLYYFILHYWMQLLGDNEFTIRLLSLTFSLLSIPLLYLIVKMCFSEKVAIIAALFIAVNPLNIYYAQFARVYAILQFLIMLLILSIIKAVSSRKFIYFLAYGIILIVLLYSHNITLFVIPVPFIYLFFNYNKKLIFQFLAVTFISLLLYVPWGIVLHGQIGKNIMSWIPKYYSEGTKTKMNLSIFYSIEVMAPSDTCFQFLPPIETPKFKFPRLIGSVFMYAFLIMGIFSILKTHRKGEFGLLFLIYPSTFLLLPYIISFKEPIYIVARTDVAAYFAIITIVIHGIFSLIKLIENPWLARGAVALGVILSIASLNPYYKKKPVSHKRDFAKYIAAKTKSKGVILTTGTILSSSLRYYLKKTGKQISFYTYPQDAGKHLGRFAVEEYEGKIEYLREDARSIVEIINKHDKKDTSFYLIYDEQIINDILLEEIKKFNVIYHLDIGPRLHLVCFENNTFSRGL